MINSHSTFGNGHSPPQLLDAYLDDMLSPAERGVFERTIADDAALRSDVDVQRDIDAAMKRLFDHTAASVSIGETASFASAASARGSPVLSHWRAIAAGIVLLIGLSWLGWIGWKASPWYPTAAERVYAMKVADGMKPDWKCENDKQFSDVFLTRHGQRLHIPLPPPAGIEFVGVAYSDTLSSYTVLVLAKVQGQQAIVMIDHLARDKPLSVRPGHGLNMFRRVVGQIVMYEVTPRDQPAVLDLITADGPLNQG